MDKQYKREKERAIKKITKAINKWKKELSKYDEIEQKYIMEDIEKYEELLRSIT